MVKLHVSTKLLISLLFSINIFMARNLSSIFLVVIALLALSLLIEVQFGQIRKVGKAFLYIFAFTFCAHLFFQKNDLLQSAFYTSRIVSLILGNALIASGVDLDEFMNTVQVFLAKSRIKPIWALKLMILLRLTMNFLPIFKDESIRIYRAQKIRGIDFGSNNIMLKANNYLALIIPVVVMSIKRADDMAVAMKARRFSSYGFYAPDSHQGKLFTNLLVILLLLCLTAANLLNYELY